MHDESNGWCIREKEDDPRLTGMHARRVEWLVINRYACTTNRMAGALERKRMIRD